MMRGDSHADHDERYSGCCNQPSQAKPVPHPLEICRLLPNFSQDVPGEEWRKLGLGDTAQNIPQLVVILTVHGLQSIQPFAESEVALECALKIHVKVQGLQEIPPAVEYGLDAAFCATPLLRSGECARG